MEKEEGLSEETKRKVNKSQNSEIVGNPGEVLPGIIRRWPWRDQL